MRKSFMAWILVGIVAAAVGTAGCSKVADKAPSGPANTVLPALPTYTLSQYLELVQRVAPPEYSTPGTENLAIPMTDSTTVDIWKDGQNALLGKVFGMDEPFSLYSNLAQLDFLTSTVNAVAASGAANGDTAVAASPEGGSLHAVVSFHRLTSPVAIPAACRTVLGLDQVSLDYVFTADVVEMPMRIQVAFARSDSAETILIWQHEMQEGNATSLTWAHRDLVHDTVRIRSMFIKAWDTNLAKWNYDIRTDGSTLFVYRMGWYGNDGDVPYVAGVVGGGSRAIQFALRFRDHSGSFTSDVSQLFGPEYAEIAGDVPAALFDAVQAPEYTTDSMLAAQLDSPFPAGD